MNKVEHKYDIGEYVLVPMRIVGIDIVNCGFVDRKEPTYRVRFLGGIGDHTYDADLPEEHIYGKYNGSIIETIDLPFQKKKEKALDNLCRDTDRAPSLFKNDALWNIDNPWGKKDGGSDE